MDEIDLREIGRRISDRRRLLNMTQEQLAEQMDVSIQMISNLERGVKAIRIDNLVRISRILKISTDYILTGKQTSTDIYQLSEQIYKLDSEHRGLVEMIVTYLGGIK